MYEAFNTLRESAVDPDQTADLLVAAIASNLDAKIKQHVFLGKNDFRVSVNVGNSNLGPDGDGFPAACNVRIHKQVGELGALRLLFLFSLNDSARREVMDNGFPSLYPNRLDTVSIVLSQPIEVKGRGRPSSAPPTLQADVCTGVRSDQNHAVTFNIETCDDPVSGGLSVPLTDIALAAWNDVCIVLIETFFLHCAQGSVFGLISAHCDQLHLDYSEIVMEEDESSMPATDGQYVDGPFLMRGDFQRLSATMETLRESGVTVTQEIVNQVSRKVYHSARDQLSEIKQARILELIADVNECDLDALRRLATRNVEVWDFLPDCGIQNCKHSQLVDVFKQATKAFRYIVVVSGGFEPNSEAAWHSFMSGDEEEEAAEDETYALSSAPVEEAPCIRDPDLRRTLSDDEEEEEEWEREMEEEEMRALEEEEEWEPEFDDSPEPPHQPQSQRSPAHGPSKSTKPPVLGKSPVPTRRPGQPVHWKKGVNRQ